MINQCKAMFLVRPTTWRKFWLAFGVHLALTCFANLFLFPSAVFQAPAELTRGLLTGTLLTNLLFMCVMGPFLLRAVGISLKDLRICPAGGWHKSSLAVGVLWTVVAVAIVNLVAAAIALSTSAEGLVFSDAWFGDRAMQHYGQILGQFAGNAFYEEVLFRAFFLTQSVLLIKKTKRKWGWGRCLLLGLLLSQCIFALMHIPNRIYKGAYSAPADVLLDQLFLCLAGCLLAATFLLTQNLYAAVGVHALVNYPILLLESPGPAIGLAAYLIVPVLLMRALAKSRSPKS